MLFRPGRNTKWLLPLSLGLVLAGIYILLDDNNVVPSSVENSVYYLTWLCITITAGIAIRNKLKKT